MYDELVPRRQTASEIGVTYRTICRWETKKFFGFDNAIKINGCVFHHRSRIEKLKACYVLSAFAKMQKVGRKMGVPEEELDEFIELLFPDDMNATRLRIIKFLKAKSDARLIAS